VAAGNRESDRGVVYRMSSALADRFIHLEMKAVWEDWFEWATEKMIHPDIMGYLSFSKPSLYTFDPQTNSRAFATPRSWSYVDLLLQNPNTDDTTLHDLIAGTLGDGIVTAFMAHRSVAGSLPNPKDILTGKVTKVDDIEVSASYSLTVGLCYELREAFANRDPSWSQQVDAYFNFILNNFETEIGIMSAKMALGGGTSRLPIDHEEISSYGRFLEKYGRYISASYQTA
jgi:hypothetical protein